MTEPQRRARVLYWSAGGNTRKVAQALHEALIDLGWTSELGEITPELDVSLDDPALLLIGAPVYQFLPPEPVRKFLQARMGAAEVLPAAPERAGRFAVVFCTYSGPHTGRREAEPMLKYTGQFLEHMGVRVVEEWAVVGEFHDPSRSRMNVEGRLGDIRGRPNASDLADVCGRLRGLVKRIEPLLG